MFTCGHRNKLNLPRSWKSFRPPPALLANTFKRQCGGWLVPRLRLRTSSLSRQRKKSGLGTSLPTCSGQIQSHFRTFRRFHTIHCFLLSGLWSASERWKLWSTSLTFRTRGFRSWTAVCTEWGEREEITVKTHSLYA